MSFGDKCVVIFLFIMSVVISVLYCGATHG